MGQADSNIEEVRSVKRGRKPKQISAPVVSETIAQCDTISAAQDLCNRIWDGQSPDLPKHERANRIKNALIARGYDPDSVVIG